MAGSNNWMARRSRVALLLLLGAVGVIILISYLSPKPPVFEGRTIEEWIYDLDAHVDHRPQLDRSREVLSKIGPLALGDIAKIISERPPSAWRRAVTRLLVTLKIQKEPRLSLDERQFRACRAAWILAEDAQVAINSLCFDLHHNLTNSNYGDTESGRALARAGQEGIHILTNLLTHPAPRIRDRVAHSLGYEREKPGVLDAFLRATSDPDRGVRFLALSGLYGKVRTDPDVAVPIGLKFLDSADQYDRWAGAKLLAAYKDDARASNVLQSLRQDTNANVRSAAERALKSPDPNR